MANANGTASLARSDASAGTTSTEGFGTTSLTRAAETASMAVAEQAKALVQARYIVALQRPRNLDDVRVRVLAECRRPGFAKVARYRKPIGRGVEGPSIRFAEAALRCLGNVTIDSPTIFDDDERQILRVSVTDLEANTSYSQDISLTKTVERTKLADGQVPISSRTNSYGKTSYLVHATEDDLLNKRNALISKAVRTLGLRLLPGDILDEAMAVCVAVAADEDAKDPGAARKAIADAFDGIGVRPAELAKYLGHGLEATSPAEIGELRALFSAIRDGEATWQDALATKGVGWGGAVDADGVVHETSKTAELRAKLDARRAPKKSPEQSRAEEKAIEDELVTEIGFIDSPETHEAWAAHAKPVLAKLSPGAKQRIKSAVDARVAEVAAAQSREPGSDG